ncbi:hypothetical protein [Coleofasciculus sp. F4-SAH-05]|uniref:hypothetical protein n=1 Tax=Coleofasciculus sp. F4-SAH-05 TaxID=3069525 RepID=UPI0032FE4F4A
MVIGHWSLVIGHWSLVIGHWSLVIGPWSFVPPAPPAPRRAMARLYTASPTPPANGSIQSPSAVTAA